MQHHYIRCMRFIVIDISNLVHRAKHAVGKSRALGSYHDHFGDEGSQDDPLSVRTGLILNVVFQGLLNAYTKFSADHCIAAFDLRSWRRDFYEDYKANRRNKVRTPQDEAEHEMINNCIDMIHDFLKEYTNVTVLQAEGAEADDLIARWVQNHTEGEFQNIIVSADGDFKQLVSGNVDLYNPMSSTLYTMDGIFHQDTRKKKRTDPKATLYDQEWFVKMNKKDEPETFDPEWELFEKCIRGDSSDNIRSAWPRVRSDKMRKAYYGSVTEYNNFINSTWGKDDNKHSVKELFDRNQTLIDLSKQPDDIKELLDETIVVALERDNARLIGAYFAKFCGQHNLPKLLQQADRFTSMLSKPYA